MPNFLMGKDAPLYIDDAVTAAVSSTSFDATAITTNVKDVTVSVSKEMIDITTRASGGWTNEAPGSKSGSVKFQMQWNPGDAQFTKVVTAFIGDTEVFIGALDQLATVSGAQGLAGNFTITSLEVQQPVKGVQMVDIEAKPSSYTTWFKKV